METFILIGRILLGIFFAMYGFMHFTNMDKMTGYAKSKGVPAPGLAVAVTGLMLLFGSATIFLGEYTQLGIIVLSVFLLVTSLSMHRFWQASGAERMSESTQFMKNIAIMGALLMML